MRVEGDILDLPYAPYEEKRNCKEDYKRPQPLTVASPLGVKLVELLRVSADEPVANEGDDQPTGEINYKVKDTRHFESVH